MTIVKYIQPLGNTSTMSRSIERALISSVEELHKLFPANHWRRQIEKFIQRDGPLLINTDGGWRPYAGVTELERWEKN